jgi:hypothetical protein
MAKREGITGQAGDQEHGFTEFSGAGIDGKHTKGEVWGRVDLNELALGEMEAEVGREGEEPGVFVALGEKRREEEREETDGDGNVGPEGQRSGGTALGVAGGVWWRN